MVVRKRIPSVASASLLGSKPTCQRKFRAVRLHQVATTGCTHLQQQLPDELGKRLHVVGELGLVLLEVQVDVFADGRFHLQEGAAQNRCRDARTALRRVQRARRSMPTWSTTLSLEGSASTSAGFSYVRYFWNSSSHSAM